LNLSKVILRISPIDRVVTMQAADGKAIIALDGLLPSILALEVIAAMIFDEV
jgi:hypothetical protein